MQIYPISYQQWIKITKLWIMVISLHNITSHKWIMAINTLMVVITLLNNSSLSPIITNSRITIIGHSLLIMMTKPHIQCTIILMYSQASHQTSQWGWIKHKSRLWSYVLPFSLLYRFILLWCICEKKVYIRVVVS